MRLKSIKMLKLKTYDKQEHSEKKTFVELRSLLGRLEIAGPFNTLQENLYNIITYTYFIIVQNSALYGEPSMPFSGQNFG